jgi:hypothetical protein
MDSQQPGQPDPAEQSRDKNDQNGQLGSDFHIIQEIHEAPPLGVSPSLAENSRDIILS